jgi:hypothetical protein
MTSLACARAAENACQTPLNYAKKCPFEQIISAPGARRKLYGKRPLKSMRKSVEKMPKSASLAGRFSVR